MGETAVTSSKETLPLRTFDGARHKQITSLRTDPGLALLSLEKDFNRPALVDLLASFLRTECFGVEEIVAVRAFSRSGTTCVGFLLRESLTPKRSALLLAAAQTFLEGELLELKAESPGQMPQAWSYLRPCKSSHATPILLGSASQLEASAAFAHELSEASDTRGSSHEALDTLSAFRPPESRLSLERKLRPLKSLTPDLAVAVIARFRGLGFVPDGAASARSFLRELPIHQQIADSGDPAVDVIAAIHFCVSVGRRAPKVRALARQAALSKISVLTVPRQTKQLLTALASEKLQASVLSWLLTLARPVTCPPGLLPCTKPYEIIRFATSKLLHVRIYLPALSHFLTFDFPARETPLLPPTVPESAHAFLDEVLALLPMLSLPPEAPTTRGEAAGWALLLGREATHLAAVLNAFCERKSSLVLQAKYFEEGLKFALSATAGDMVRQTSVLADYLERHGIRLDAPQAGLLEQLHDPSGSGNLLWELQRPKAFFNYVKLLSRAGRDDVVRQLCVEVGSDARVWRNAEFRVTASRAFGHEERKKSPLSIPWASSDELLFEHAEFFPSLLPHEVAGFLFGRWHALLEEGSFAEAAEFLRRLHKSDRAFFLLPYFGNLFVERDVEKNAAVCRGLAFGFEAGGEFCDALSVLIDALVLPFAAASQSPKKSRGYLARWANLLRLSERNLVIGASEATHLAFATALVSVSKAPEWLPTRKSLEQELEFTTTSPAVLTLAHPFWHAYLEAPDISSFERSRRALEVMERLGFHGPKDVVRVDNAKLASALRAAFCACVPHRLNAPDADAATRKALIAWTLDVLDDSPELCLHLTRVFMHTTHALRRETRTIALGMLIDRVFLASLNGDSCKSALLASTALTFLCGGYWRFQPEGALAFFERLLPFFLTVPVADRRDFSNFLQVFQKDVRRTDQPFSIEFLISALEHKEALFSGGEATRALQRSGAATEKMLQYQAWGRGIALFSISAKPSLQRLHWAEFSRFAVWDPDILEALREFVRTSILNEKNIASLSLALDADLDERAVLFLLHVMIEEQERARTVRVPLLMAEISAIARIRQSTMWQESLSPLFESILTCATLVPCNEHQLPLVKKTLLFVTPCLNDTSPAASDLTRLEMALVSMALRVHPG